MGYETVLKIVVFMQIAIIFYHVYRINKKDKGVKRQLELVRKMMYEGIERKT